MVTADDWVDADLTLEDCCLNSTVSQRLTKNLPVYIKISVRCRLLLQNSLSEGPVSSGSVCFPPKSMDCLDEDVCEAFRLFTAET